MNGLNNTAFAFLDYQELALKDKKKYIDECNDFEKYLFDLLSQSK